MEGVELEILIKDCVAGNRKAQQKLFNLFSEDMFGVCLYYSKDYTEAEDTLHEGFMKVFQKIEQFKFKGSLAGWMRRVMINTALEKFRKQNQLYALGDDFESSEDIHGAVEKALVGKVGSLGEKLHTGRSRNDQVSLDMRLYVREAIGRMIALIKDMQKVLLR